MIGSSVRIAELQAILGDHDAAEKALLSLRGDCGDVLGDHRYCRDAVEQLARVYLDQGRREEAEAAYRDVVAMVEASAADDGDALGTAHHNVGFALMEQGRLDDAEPWFRRGREHQVAASGEASLEVAVFDKSLATLDLRRGRFVEAEAGFRRVLETRTRLSGGDHPLTGSAPNDVGVALFQQGRVADAVPFMERAVAVFEASYGPLHMETLIGTNNVCILLQNLERTDEAMPRCVRAADGFRTLFGDAHSHSLMASMSLAGAELKAGRPGDARARLAEGLPRARDAFAEENPIVLARWLLNLAKAELALGDRTAAVALAAEGGALVASTDAASDADRQRVAEIEAALRDESPPGSIESAAAPR